MPSISGETRRSCLVFGGQHSMIVLEDSGNLVDGRPTKVLVLVNCLLLANLEALGLLRGKVVVVVSHG